MRYLLVLGFHCEVFRKEPRARIFVGDNLIDECIIQHHKDTLSESIKKFYEDKHILYPWPRIEFSNIYKKSFPPLKFYEIKINEQQQELSLRIDVDNSDSNYNNGFYSKGTLLQLKVFAFFPLNKELLAKLQKIIIKNIYDENLPWIYNSKNFVFELSGREVKWLGKNKQIVATSTESFFLQKIGGDGCFVVELKKKYGILIGNIAKPFGLYFRPVINYLIDKYEQHANQRNRD